MGFKFPKIIVLISLVGLSDCNFNLPTNHSNGNFDLQTLPQEMLLYIPTYDGSNQATHPDVLFFPEGRNGIYFYLVMTPYPWSNNRYENPSLLFSRNGVNFYEPVTGLNPLVPQPTYDHNNDPDLIFNPLTEAFNIFYLETMRPDSQNTVLLTSPDGIKWRKKTAVHYDLKAGDPFILSPAVIFVDSCFYMFYVKAQSTTQTEINYITSPDGEKWEKDSVNRVSTNFSAQFAPWHLDVFRDENYFYMLCCGPYKDLNLYLGQSTDLQNWKFLEEPIIRRSKNFYDSERIYRSSGIVQDNLLVVYFSLRTNLGQWRIGLKKFSLMELFKNDLHQ